MANWFLGCALAEEAEAENAPWSFLGEGVTFWVTVAVLLVVGVAVYLVTRKGQQEVLLDGKDDGSRRNVHGAVVRAEPD